MQIKNNSKKWASLVLSTEIHSVVICLRSNCIGAVLESITFESIMVPIIIVLILLN